MIKVIKLIFLITLSLSIINPAYALFGIGDQNEKTEIIIIENLTINETTSETDPYWRANFSVMYTDECPAGNYSYGINTDATWKCRDDATGGSGSYLGYYNRTLINESELVHQGDTKLGIVDSFIDGLIDLRVTQAFIKALGFYDDTEVYNKSEVDANLSNYIPQSEEGNLNVNSSLWWDNKNSTTYILGSEIQNDLNWINTSTGDTNCNASGSCAEGDVAYIDYPNTGDLNVTSGNDICIVGDKCLSDVSGDNTSWNKSYADTLYAAIIWGYNQTTPAIDYADATFIPLTAEGDLNVNASTWWSSVSGWVEGWFIKTGDDLDFNETKLNATIDAKIATITYLAESIVNNSGTLTSGNITSILAAENDDEYNVTELIGANPLTVTINFTGIEDFNSILIREKYVGGSGHEIAIETYNYNTQTYDEKEEITDMSDYAYSIFQVFNTVNYINDTNVSIRLRHIQNGISSHQLSLDYIALINGFSTVVNSEHDALAGRDLITNHPQYMDTAATRNFTGVVNINSNLSVQDYWCNNTDCYTLEQLLENNQYINGSGINLTDNVFSIVDSFINGLIDNRVTQAFIKALGFYDDTEVYNKSEVDANLSFYLLLTDQRFNDTSYIDTALTDYYTKAEVYNKSEVYNTSEVYTKIEVDNNLSLYLLLTDQRFNETTLINNVIAAVNTTVNIQALGFYNSSEVDTLIGTANLHTHDSANITNEIWVDVSGDTMTGNLNMSENNITDVNVIYLDGGAKIQSNGSVVDIGWF